MPRATCAGKYAAFVLDKKVDRAKNGGIQFVARGELSKWWDKEKKAWIELQTPVQETAYLTLLTGSRQINRNQVDNLKRAFRWDGKSTKALHNMDVSKIEVVFEVEEDIDPSTGKQKTNQDGSLKFKTAWISPMGGFRPVTAEDVDGLDKEWAEIEAADSAKPAVDFN